MAGGGRVGMEGGVASQQTRGSPPQAADLTFVSDTM